MNRALYSPVEMLERLVAFPTVSSDSNLDLIAFVRQYLAGHGIESTTVMNEDGTKANLFATVGPMLEGGVILSGHTDVVPAPPVGWDSDPWTLTEWAGRLYGRGTCDMKGFVASVLAMVPTMVEVDLRVPVHIALSYDEEVGCKGAPSLVECMTRNLPTPRAVIVGEPTKMEIVNGHKSSFSLYTNVTGHAAHSSRIDTAVSAVAVAAGLVTWLDGTMAGNRERASEDCPFVPPYTTLHCGMISGGSASNVVAAATSFVTDIRTIPEEDPEAYHDRYLAFIREAVEPAMKTIAPETGVQVVPRGSVPSLAPETDGDAEGLVREISRSDRPGQAASYATEAGIFQRAGWSTVVMGPGDIEQAHKANEYVARGQMEACGIFLERLIARLAS